MNFKEKTKKHIKKDGAFKLLEKYVNMIEEKKQVMSLTNFYGDKLWEEGIYESIVSLEKAFNKKTGKILDIGAGAGFPSIPYIIVYPQNELTIYEPIGKRVVFLEEVIRKLNLNVNIKRVRVEDSKEVDIFDFITARAVMPFKFLIEVCYHTAKIGALFAFIKGSKVKEEIHKARFNIKKFKLKIETLNVIVNDKRTNIITYKKNHKTPNGYPRNWNQIKNT